MLLAGDLGGTKTALALYESSQKCLMERTFLSQSFDSLEAVIRAFLAETKALPKYASFGVAGPVLQDSAQITNLAWQMSENGLANTLGFETVYLLNDLQAIATGIPELPATDLLHLNEGVLDPQAPIAVIAPGTGLGEAYLTHQGDHYQAHASEGGHSDFAPTTALELDLLRFLQGRYGHVSYERLISGKGISNIYAFFRQSYLADEPKWLSDELAKSPDPTPVIVQAALDKRSTLCEQTLELFIQILASEAGNLALKLLSTAGVDLAGGIPPRIKAAIDPKTFLKCFSHKGHMGALLQDIPIHIRPLAKIHLNNDVYWSRACSLNMMYLNSLNMMYLNSVDTFARGLLYSTLKLPLWGQPTTALELKHGFRAKTS